MSNQTMQIMGEDAAANHLQSLGYKIVARNWRVRMGEIDLVVTQGDTLVIVEVKARSPGSLAPPYEAVGWVKQQRLRRLAEAYVVMERPTFESCRFDVVSVVGNDKGVVTLEHLQDAF
ncbi:MAG: YraN family protein [Actinomycetota bacterium]